LYVEAKRRKGETVKKGAVRHVFVVLAVLATTTAGLVWPFTIAHAANIVITFDDPPVPAHGTYLSTEYQAKGVIFGRSPTANNARSAYLWQVGAGKAHSGTHVALIEQSRCGSAEIRLNEAWGRFTSLHQHVQMFASEIQFAPPYNYRVTLEGVGAGGQVLASDTRTVSGGQWTLLSVTRVQGDIAFFHVVAAGVACTAIDDLSFDVPATAGGPDFGLAYYALGIGAAPGHSGAGTVVVNRFNNSSGRIQFSVTGLPQGMTANFSPQPLAGSDLSAQVTLTVAASPSAPAAVDVAVTVTGTALDASAGNPSQPRSVVIPVTVASVYTLIVKGIEVTQGIQRMDAVAHRTRTNPAVGTPGSPLHYQGVTLQAGRKTIVRLYATALGSSDLDDVHAALYGYDAGNHLLPGVNPILPDNGPTVLGSDLNTYTDDVTYAERTRLSSTPFEFTLPPSWTLGTVTLRALVTPPAQASFDVPTAAACGTAECLQLREIALSGVAFRRTKSITIVPVTANLNGILPAQPSIVFASALTLTPVDITVTDYQGDIEMIDINSSNDDRNTQSSEALDRIEDWDEDNGYPGQMVIGVTTEYNDKDLGMENSEVVFEGRPRAVVDQARALTSVAHELNHGLGRVHAAYACGAEDTKNGAVEHWPPDEMGEIEGVGFDVSGSAPRATKAPPTLGPNAQPRWYDFMSYCAGYTKDSNGIIQDQSNVWTSDRGWDKVINKFLAWAPGVVRPLARRLGSVLGWRSGPAGEAAKLRAGGNVRSAASPTAPAAPLPVGGAPPAGTLLEVTGYSTGAGIRIARVRPATGRPVAGRAGDAYHLRVLDPSGRTLTDAPMLVRTAHADPSPAGPAGPVTLLKAVVPGDGSARVAIMRGTAVLAERTRSAHLPAVTLIAPAPGSILGAGPPGITATTGAPTTVRWDAKHPDGNRLMAKVDYSVDGGRSWRTVYAGPNKNEATIPNGYLTASGPGQARLRVRVNDGFNEVSVTSGELTAAGSPPSVRIDAPRGQQEVRADALVFLKGIAFDDAFRPLPVDALSWTVDGRVVGVGGTQTATGLAPGPHVVRLAARDGRGRQASAEVRVTVLPVKPLFLQLNPPRDVGVSDRSVTLTVASTLPATMAIDGRTVAQVDRNPKTLTVPVAAGTGPVLLRLSLTALGQTTSTTLVIRRRAP